MFSKVLLDSESFSVFRGLLGGITVLVKHRNLSVKATSEEARYLSALIDELEKRGVAIEPGNETLESALTHFANAVAMRGGARWQMFFLLKSPAEAVNEYIR